MRKVALQIISTDLHCNNECPGITFGTNPDSGRCLFFGEDLVWNEQKRSNGYRRVDACKKAEISNHQTLREALESLLKEYPDGD